MTQLGESVAFGQAGGSLDCPFDHKKKEVKPKTNAMPRWEANSADTLGENLADDHLEPIDVDVNDRPLVVQFTPHHVLPGNASWPNTELRKWVDKRPGHILENIGYDVNEDYNGVSLPGNSGYRASVGKSWSGYGDQADYAFTAMKAAGDLRQFHDAHPAYNEFVTKVLDKVSEKLDAKIRDGGPPGCGKKDCAGDKRKQKKYDPPVGLMERLDGIADRLRGYLVAPVKKWKMPIYTSRFALMYKMKLTEEDARGQLSQAQEDAQADKF